jgi:YcxB-like protein
VSGEGGFTTTEEDLVAANRLHARQLWNRRAVLRGWVLGTVTLAVIAIWLCERVDWKMVWVPLVAAGYMVIGALVSQLTFSHFARRHYRQARSFWHPTTLEWDSNSIRFASDRGNVRYNWTDFFSWAADDRSILLYQTGNSFITVPTRGLSEEAKIEIVSALKGASVGERSLR